MKSRCVHFVGFRTDSEYWAAVRIWGAPDFIHYYWDHRAKNGGERSENDILVFAKGTDQDQPKEHAFNDSERF